MTKLSRAQYLFSTMFGHRRVFWTDKRREHMKIIISGMIITLYIDNSDENSIIANIDQDLCDFDSQHDLIVTVNQVTDIESRENDLTKARSSRATVHWSM